MFEPNNHSKWKVQWKAVSTDCLQEVCDVLQMHYGITGVTLVQQVDEWEQASNNYRVKCTILGRQQTVLVRRNILSGVDDLWVSTSAILRLRRYGVSTPEVMGAGGESHFVEYRGQCWQMFEFVPGDHFRGEEDELSQAAILIAKMHQAFAEFPSEGLAAAYIDAAVGPLECSYWDAASRLKGVNEFEEFVLQRQNFIRDEVRRADDVLSKAKVSDVIHGDLHPQNFLFPGKQQCVILDFGNMCFADRGYDIAMACHRLVRQYVVHQGMPWQDTLPKGIGIFLEAYVSMDQSAKQRVKLLPAFMKGLLFRKMAYNLGLYRKGARSWESCLLQWKRFFGFLGEVDAIEKVLG